MSWCFARTLSPSAAASLSHANRLDLSADSAPSISSWINFSKSVLDLTAKSWVVCLLKPSVARTVHEGLTPFKSNLAALWSECSKSEKLARIRPRDLVASERPLHLNIQFSFSFFFYFIFIGIDLQYLGFETECRGDLVIIVGWRLYAQTLFLICIIYRIMYNIKTTPIYLTAAG